MGKRLYVALSGDVPGSRRIGPDEREELQDYLVAWAEELTNSAPPGVLAARLVLSGGDGVQTLLHAAGGAHAVDLIQALSDRLFGFAEFPAILFGVGLGTLSTGDIEPGALPKPNPGALDGPCFHRARKALELAQKEGEWVRFEGWVEPENQALNALLALMGSVRTRWTAKQGIITHEARQAATQKRLADERNVSPSVISEALKAARFRQIVEGEAAARALIEAGVRTAEETAGDAG